MIADTANLHIDDTAGSTRVGKADLRARQITLEFHVVHIQDAPGFLGHYATAAEDVGDAASGSANWNGDVERWWRVAVGPSTVARFWPSPARAIKVFLAAESAVGGGRVQRADGYIRPNMQQRCIGQHSDTVARRGWLATCRPADHGMRPIDEGAVLAHYDGGSETIDRNHGNQPLRSGSRGVRRFEKQEREIGFDGKCRSAEEVWVKGSDQCQHGVCSWPVQRREQFWVGVSFGVKRGNDSLALRQMKCMLFRPGWAHNVWNGDADGKSKQQYRGEER